MVAEILVSRVRNGRTSSLDGKGYGEIIGSEYFGGTVVRLGKVYAHAHNIFGVVLS